MIIHLWAYSRCNLFELNSRDYCFSSKLLFFWYNWMDFFFWLVLNRLNNETKMVHFHWVHFFFWTLLFFFFSIILINVFRMRWWWDRFQCYSQKQRSKIKKRKLLISLEETVMEEPTPLSNSLFLSHSRISELFEV